MKIDLYLDIPPYWNKAQDLYATTNPMQKYDGTKRYKITANIPFNGFEIDGAAPVEDILEVDKND